MPSSSSAEERQQWGTQAARQHSKGGRLPAEVEREGLGGAAAMGKAAVGAHLREPIPGGKRGAGSSEPMRKGRESEGDLAGRGSSKHPESHQGRPDTEERLGGANVQSEAGSKGAPPQIQFKGKAAVQQMPCASHPLLYRVSPHNSASP